jgi:hypothetical protein
VSIRTIRTIRTIRSIDPILLERKAERIFVGGLDERDEEIFDCAQKLESD